jgi:hypothetical protein
MTRSVPIALALAALAAPTAHAASCPTAPDPAALPTAAQLEESNTFLASLGARPTGSATQQRYIAWIRQQLKGIPGVQRSELKYKIRRWTPRSARLTVRLGGRTRTLPIASAVPYSKPTSAKGSAAPLTYVPAGTDITADNAAGKLVVRDAPAGSVQYALLFLPFVSWEVYDPGNTIDPSGNLYGDFINYLPRIADLRNAKQAGAKGIIFVKDRPRRQIVGHYEPYEGEAWGVPGVFLGSDEGKALTDALAAGKHPTARIYNRASYKTVTTPSIEATIPGQSPQRIVIDSHTDGTNAVEDNGPIAMVAMARYLAALPMECRPRTIQFAFSTAHFYQRVKPKSGVRDGGAEQLAQQLDADYDKGTVSIVLVLEHLGARDYEQVDRTDGGPGKELKDTGLRAIQFVGVTPAPMLVKAVDGVVRSYDMQRSILLQGSDAPGGSVPQHCSFGGEGTPYERHLLPTIGVIAAPQFLYDPAIELEGIDFDVMHSELLGWTEMVNTLGTMSQSDISGTVDSERQQRANGAPACPPDG